jgi:hypothetical protein
MRRRALNRCFRAAPAEAFVTAFFVVVVSVLAFAISATQTHAEANEHERTRSAEQDARVAARRALQAALDGCSLYVKDSCETALRSPVILDNERADALAWRGIAETFERDQGSCKSGSLAACEAAIASPAADAHDRERLEKLKGAIPLRVPLVEQARPQAVPPVESPTPAATPTTGEWPTWLKQLAASIADVVTYARSAVPIYALIASGLVAAFAWLFLARLLRFARWLRGPVAAWFNRPQAAGSNVGSLSPELASAPEPHDRAVAPLGDQRVGPWAVRAEGSRKSPWAVASPEVRHPTLRVPSKELSLRVEVRDYPQREERRFHREARVTETTAAPRGDRSNASLLTASMVLGIIGGALGLLAALFGNAVVGAAGALSGRESEAALLQLFLLASPIVSIVGAAIVKGKPILGAALMGLSILPLLHFFGFNFFTMLPISLSGLGAMLAVLAIPKGPSRF